MISISTEPGMTVEGEGLTPLTGRRRIRPKGSSGSANSKVVVYTDTPCIGGVNKDEVRGVDKSEVLLPSTKTSISSSSSSSSRPGAVWTIVASSDALQRLLRTLQYIQEAAITITNGVSRAAKETPYETKDRVINFVLRALDASLTPIPPSLRHSMAASRRHTSLSTPSSSIPRSLSMTRPSNSFPLFSHPPFGTWLEKLLGEPGLSPLEALIGFVASQSGVNPDRQDPQPFPTAVILKLLQVIASATGVDLNACLKHSQQQSIKHRGETILDRKRRLRGACNDPKTGIVLSYVEREDVEVPAVQCRRIKRMMHHEINVKPFDARIVLPHEPTSPHDDDGGESRDISNIWDECATPCSFPPSPVSRSALLLDFTGFTEEVLYRARDALRCEHNGSSFSRLATFNPLDAHPDIAITCGGHCAQKIGEGLYRSVRAGLNIPKGVPVLFEMCIKGVATAQVEPLGSSICVGVSSTNLMLNTYCGSGLSSIGLCSSGHVVSDGQWEAVMNRGLHVGDTIGVVVVIDGEGGRGRDSRTSSGGSQDDCVGESSEDTISGSGSFTPSSSNSFDVGGGSHVDESEVFVKRSTVDTVEVYFYVNGSPIGCEEGSNSPRCFSTQIRSVEDLMPTLSLYSSSVKVMSQFAMADLVYGEQVIAAFPNAVALDKIPITGKRFQ